LHQSGVFNELHDTYGPDGTDELVVLWVEVQGASIAQLQGADPSQGDWTEGGEWPVPIISSTSVLRPVFSELYSGYIPSVFMACPSGYYKDVTTEAWESSSKVYAQIGTCQTIGIDDINNSFSIYPNPAKDIININNAKDANIEFFDLVGKLIISQKNIGREEVINVSMLNNGVYFIKVKKERTVKTQTIIISK